MPCPVCQNDPCTCFRKRKWDEPPPPVEKRPKLEESVDDFHWLELGSDFDLGDGLNDLQSGSFDLDGEVPYEPVPDVFDITPLSLLWPSVTDPSPVLESFPEWEPLPPLFDELSGPFPYEPDDVWWSEHLVSPSPRVTPSDVYEHRRSATNTIVREPWRIGVVTWNINHYRDAKVEDTTLSQEFTTLVRSVKRAVVYDPSTIDGNLHDVLVEQDRESVLQRLDTFAQTQKKRKKEFNTGVRDRAAGARGVEKWSDVLKALDTYLKKTEQSRKLVGVKRSLRQLASKTYLDNHVAYMKRRIERAQIWSEQARRLAQIDGVQLPLVEDENLVQPSSIADAFKSFNAALANAKKSFAVLKGELKRRAIVLLAAHMFAKNPWLDAMVLQEVNAIGGLVRWAKDDLMVQRYPVLDELAIEPGPHLIGGKGALKDTDDDNDDGGADDEDDVADELAPDAVEEEVKTGRGRQHEYYPIIYRKSRLKWGRAFVLDTKGEEQSVATYRWDKEQGIYRPIVVHQLVPEHWDNQPVYIAAVHTTPGALAGQKSDREFDRRNEFDQLKAAFKTISQRSTHGERWIVGGDYYLSDESIAVDPNELSKKEIRERLDRRDYEEQLQSINTRGKTGRITYKGLFELETPKKIVDKLGILEMTGSARLKDRMLPTSRVEVVRHILEVTFKKALGSELGTAQPVSGSNWHDVELLHRARSKLKSEDRAQFFATARVADLFVYTNKHFKSWEVGLVHPDANLVLADSEDLLSTSQFWAMVSDHFPVGAYFSVEENDEHLEVAVRTEAEQRDAAAWMERYRRAFLLHKYLVNKGEIELTVPKQLAPQVVELDEWLNAIATLVELGPVKGKGGELTVDVRLYNYRRSRARGSHVRVWYDRDWYGHELFRQGDANGFWAALDELLSTASIGEVKPNDYVGEGTTQEELIDVMNVEPQ